MASPTGIVTRHGRGCASLNDGRRCNCEPAYEAWVYDKREGRKLRRTFADFDAAKGWRADAVGEVRRGRLRAVESVTLRQAAEKWLAEAKDGLVRARTGDPYKPSALRGYEQALNQRILPELGGAKLAEIRRVDVQDLADRLLRQSLDPSTIRNALMPLRAIYRRALSRGEVAVNPTTGIELPRVAGRRERIAAPDEIERLIAALPAELRSLYATAAYAGLRRGELQALRWEDVDLASGVIRVERSWDAQEGVIDPKSQSGKRKVPIAAVLRDYLDQHKLHQGRDGGLVFGTSATHTFTPSAVRRRAETAWKQTNKALEKELGRELTESERLWPIGLHEARHTFASLMIAAGVNAKALSTYLGHSSITITFDRYGHLMPGNEEEAAALLDAYLERASTQARLAQVAAAPSSTPDSVTGAQTGAQTSN